MIIVQALPHVSKKSVAAAFVKAQEALLGRRKGRAISESNIALVYFVEEQTASEGVRPPWARLMAAWNARRRTWRYRTPSGWRNMRRDYENTAERVYYSKGF